MISGQSSPSCQLCETGLRAAGGDLDRLEDAAEEIFHAWSGSNLGYQAEVYYENLKRPPSGAFFSLEWGFNGSSNLRGTTRSCELSGPGLRPVAP